MYYYDFGRIVTGIHVLHKLYSTIGIRLIVFLVEAL